MSHHPFDAPEIKRQLRQALQQLELEPGVMSPNRVLEAIAPSLAPVLGDIRDEEDVPPAVKTSSAEMATLAAQLLNETREWEDKPGEPVHPEGSVGWMMKAARSLAASVLSQREPGEG